MRLHRLTATAFGPFASDVDVDLDQLSDSGLFLLCGPTGAGKTSVLDAICFALYGDVPGDRGSAKRLRSDLAAEGVAPRVVLEVTVSARRFRFTRSPRWTRPKRRGTGTTPQQATVLIEERRDGEWIALTSRPDEAGQLVTELVGMTLPQFCQVAMLPQGRFQDFLRAGSEDRQRLLEQLFGTRRFADIEHWVRDRARSLHCESRSALEAVSTTVSRLLEAGDADLPEALGELGPASASGALVDWATTLTLTAHEAAARSADALAVAADDEAEAAADLADGRRTTDLRARHREATAALEGLEADAPAHARRRHRLEAARRAAPAAPLHALATEAADRRDRAAAAAEEARRAAATVLGTAAPSPDELTTDDLPTDDLTSAADATRSRLATLEVLAPREAELAGLERACTRHERRADELAAETGHLRTVVAALPERVTALRTDVDAAVRAAGELVGLRGDETALRRRLRAWDALHTTSVELAQARGRADEAARLVNDLKETWLALREARLDGMAAEIAAALAVGASCPVCGSHDHPHKAVAGSEAPDADAERAARRALDDAEVARVALDDRVRDLQAQRERHAHDAGDDGAEELRVALEALTATTAAATALAAREPALRAELVAAEAEEQEVRERCRTAEVELAGLRSTLAADRATSRRLRTSLDQALAGTGCETVGALVDRLSADLRVLDGATTASTALATAARAAEQARGALATWSVEHGFGSVDEALACLVRPDDLEALDREVRAHEERLVAVRAVLEDPDVARAAEAPAPDLATLVAAHEQAATRRSAVRTAAEVDAGRARRLDDLATRLAAAVAAWIPVHDEHEVAAGLAGLLEGTSADNELRMRLSAYVLAWRLGQVVDAANDRLLHMSDRRYSLEHTGRRGARERRGGLSLLVRDEWSGDTRDPVTLSGGETFVVSLALALGLADVVGGEAGGTELDTLFVDEGFGSLDADTLDDVMDTLDSLRDGGRVVGVVSHVTELRSRIPVQLRVDKARVGSTLALVRAAD